MRPAAPLIILWTLWSLAGALIFFTPSAAPYWIAAGGILALAAAADALIGKRLKKRDPNIRISRKAPDVMTVGIPEPAEIKIASTGKSLPRFLRVYEELPGTLRAEPYPIVLRGGRSENSRKRDINNGDNSSAATPNSRRRLRRTNRKNHAALAHTNTGDNRAETRITITWTPLRRGLWKSAGFRLELPSRLNLFRLHYRLENPHEIMVLPDLGLKGSSTEDALEHRRELAGQVQIRRRGQGTDFRELRDYMPGDPVRHIDWRATSRRSHPIVKTFQDERDQQLLIILDGGYRLHQKDGEGLQFDKALQAALRLSHVALEHGDRVGVYAYGEKDRWIPPGSGRSYFWTLVRSLYDFESAPVATSPAAALERVLVRLNRRTLLIFITNLREEDGEVVSWMLPLVRGRHLMMAVTLREEGAEGPSTITTEDDALLFGASTLYREQRTRLRRYWEKQGILTLDALPDHVTGKVINRYLALKGAGIL